MLNGAQTLITFSVDDVSKAKKFYKDVLGLELDESMPGLVSLKGINIAFYERKKSHKPGGYTLINFTVDDLDETMKELKSKGLTFEKYDTEDAKTDENGVLDYGMMRIAFFNDPAGNNHGVLEMVEKA